MTGRRTTTVQEHRLALALHDEAVAVMFHLVNPIGAGWDLGARGVGIHG